MEEISHTIDNYSFMPQIPVNVKTGLVAFMDILGYSSIKTENLARVAGHIFAAMDDAVTQKDVFMEGLDYTNYMPDEDLIGYVMPKDEQGAIAAAIGLVHDRISVSMVSDSFICCADLSEGLSEQDKSFVVSAFINIVSSIYCSLFTNGLPLRGGITYGRYVANDWQRENGTAFLGEAVMLAHCMEMSINAGCIALDKSAFEIVGQYYAGSEKSQFFQKRYDTRLCLSEVSVKRYGVRNLVCIDRDNASKNVWQGAFRGMVESSFAEHGKFSSVHTVGEKVENTIRFFENSKPYSFKGEEGTRLWYVYRRIVHFCAGLQFSNGMANTARQFVKEELMRGDDSMLTNNLEDIVAGVDEVVIHGAWLPVLWKAAKRAKSVGAKLVIRPAGSYDPVRRAFHGWKKKLVSFFEHQMLRRADVLLATCEAEAEWIKSYEPKVKSITLTDLKRFFNLSSVPCSPLSISRPMHLLYLGRRHPLKGLDNLFIALRQLSPHIQVQSENIGQTYILTSESASPTCASKLEMKVISNAFGDELEKVWNWCDVLILPTLSENFGRVIAEALERGKRVITTDGAPAWDPSTSATKDNPDGTYGGRLIYLRGYRDGTPEVRVNLLKSAIESLTCCS